MKIRDHFAATLATFAVPAALAAAALTAPTTLTSTALSATPPQTNHAPTVRIESPANNSVLNINTPITYQVHVTDPEDGDSRYDEINPKEVIVELATSHSPAAPADSALTIMATNNCFNCHQFNSQSLGPSFFDIAKRYPLTADNTDTLINRIRSGSSGVWGRTEKMPSHPELSTAAIRSTVRWILRSAARPDRAWYSGASGILHFPSNRPGTYTLTATYTDHGTKDQPTVRLKGSDRILINVR
ncbi:MAG TPA: c-type cytochrome [Puia sp.]|jgi:cytochrome c|nr:c-type cytochrome [Puia sp.]